MQEEICLEFSKDILDFLDSNNISLGDILESKKLDYKSSQRISPYIDETGERSKSLVLVILASSVAVISIAYAVSSVLHEIYSKPHKIEIFEDIEIRDKDGNLIFDENNNILSKRVKRIDIVKPSKENITNEIKLNMDLKKGISIHFRTLKDDK